MNVLLDTGPLVALLDRSEPDHDRIQKFMPVCAAHDSSPPAPGSPRLFISFQMCRMARRASLFFDASGTEVREAFSAEALAAAVRLMSKYADVPMDFPDATLVWIAELSGTDGILTLDRRGFSSFRFGRRRRFRLLLDLRAIFRR